MPVDPIDAEAIIKAAFDAEPTKIMILEYLQRGRHLQSYPLADVEDLWVQAYKTIVAIQNPDTARAMGDVHSELLLRGAEPPFDRVQAEIEVGMTKIQEEGPARRSLGMTIVNFIDDSEKPKH